MALYIYYASQTQAITKAKKKLYPNDSLLTQPDGVFGITSVCGIYQTIRKKQSLTLKII